MFIKVSLPFTAVYMYVTEVEETEIELALDMYVQGQK